MTLTGAETSKRKRYTKVLRDGLVPTLIATGRLAKADKDNLIAVRAAVSELCNDWRDAVARNGGRDLVSRFARYIRDG